MPQRTENSRAYLAIAVAMVSISFASILIKWCESPPFVIAAYRLGFTCALLAPYLLLTGGFSEIRSFDRREIALIVLSATALTFHFGLWIVSLSLTLVATSVVLVTSHPIFVAAVSHFVMQERVKRAAAIGVIVAFSGVAVISFADYGVKGLALLGDLMAFLGGICAGIYFLSGRLARQSVGVGPYAFSVYGLSSVLLFIAAAVAGDDLVVTEYRDVGLFLLLALVPTICGHTMFNYALKRVPAHIISTSVLGEPVGASLLAYFLLEDQVPSLEILLGGGLVVVGLYVVLSMGYADTGEDRALKVETR